MMIALDDLMAEQFYWARRCNGPDAEREPQIVRVSSIFGITPEFLTVATVGSDQYYALDEFDFIGVVLQFDVRESDETQGVNSIGRQDVLGDLLALQNFEFLRRRRRHLRPVQLAFQCVIDVVLNRSRQTHFGQLFALGTDVPKSETIAAAFFSRVSSLRGSLSRGKIFFSQSGTVGIGTIGKLSKGNIQQLNLGCCQFRIE
jgi:hypothetical protein